MQKRGTTTAAAAQWQERSGSGKRRAPKRNAGAKTYRATMIEPLESRRLLTTLYGGGDGQAASYVFTTAGVTPPAPATGRITIFGNVIAEFIFVDPSGTIVNRPVTFNGPGGVNNGTGGSITSDAGLDIFAIYVSQSDINSYIAVERLGDGNPIGSGQPHVFIPANPLPDPDPTASAGSGSMVLGTQVGGTSGLPVIKVDSNGAAIGVRPAGLDDLPEDPFNDLSAGLRVANGNDLGKFLFDGKVFGKVHIDGSINTFYAGWLLTGDARGATEGSGLSGLPVSLADNFSTPEDQALGASGHIVPRRNFFVGGDIQNLLSDGPIGWNAEFIDDDHTLPEYLSGVDIYVRGRIGQVHGNEGNSATITALNMDPAVAGFVRPSVYQEEAEGWAHFPGAGLAGEGLSNGGFPNSINPFFSGGVIRGPRQGRDAVPFQNDTFDSFQLLNSFNSPLGVDIIDLLGSLSPTMPDSDNDIVDYYGIALMAGQKIQAQVISLSGNGYIGIFDPDGRLIASTYNNLSTPVGGPALTSDYTNQLPIQFTADRPGVYRIAIGQRGDADFAGSPNVTVSPDMYQLRVTGLKPMAIGGVMAANQGGSVGATSDESHMFDIAPGTHQVQAQNGDVGAVWVRGQYNTATPRLFVATGPLPPNTIGRGLVFGSIYVANGDFRALDVEELGQRIDGTQLIGAGIDLNVPNGSVGLVQNRTLSTGADNPDTITELNPSLQENFNTGFTGGTGGLPPPTDPTAPVPFTPAQLAIGGSYQVINTPGALFTGAVVADAGMGTLRALEIAGAERTYIHLDADNRGFDGHSDLIDVTLSIAGPALQHGPGGNFRYMRVGGVVGVDPQFGTSTLGYVAHPYGQSVQFVDDSGSLIDITPVGNPIPNPAFNPLDPTFGPQMILPQLTTLTYPVRSGGVIVIDVQSTRSIAINTSGGSFASTAEISRVEVHGPGTPPLATTRFTKNGYVTTLTQPFNSHALNTSLTVSISGTAVTDVAYIAGLVAEPGNSFFPIPGTVVWEGNLTPTFRSTVTDFSNLTAVSNTTGGEILSLNALNVGDLHSTGPIGVTRTTAIAGNSINFIDPISVGTAYGTRTDRPVNPTGTDVIGNAFPFNRQTYGIAVGGHIVSIRSNTAVGNIIATGIIGSVVANADGRNVANVFEGIAGPIVASAQTAPNAPGSPAGVPNGSILSVAIGEGVGSAGSGNLAYAGIFAGNHIGTISGSNADIRGTIVFGQTLNSINLNNGSLIDANVLNIWSNTWASARESGAGGTSVITTNFGIVRSLGNITLRGDGGIIGTLIAASSIGPINVAGFGILTSNISTPFASAGISSITVGGYGIRDTIINVGNDLPVVNVTGNGSHLPTSRVSDSVRQSESVFANPHFSFGFDPFSGRSISPFNDIHSALGTSQASPTIPGVTDTGVIENTQIASQRTIGRITANVIRGDFDPAGRPLTRFNAGNRIGTIQTRRLINGLQVITGGIDNFVPASDVMALFMTVSGPIENLRINGSLGRGSVIEAIGPNGRIGNVFVKRDLTGIIRAVQSVGTVTIGRNLNGSLVVDALRRGGLGLQRLQVGGTMKNGSLRVGGPGRRSNVGDIIIKKGLGAANSSDSLFVSGSINRLQVGGVLNMDVQAGNINHLQARRINSDVRAGELRNLVVTRAGLHGNVRVARLGTASIAGGVTGRVHANNGFGTVTVSSGNVANTASFTSNFGGIERLSVLRGGLFGDVTVAREIGDIIVRKNLGDGTPMEISGRRLRLLQVGGSIRENVSVRIRGPIDALVVRGDLEAGALVQATELRRQDINGNVFGSLLIG